MINEDLHIAVTADNTYVLSTPPTLITTPGFIDKYLCKTIKQSLASFDKIPKEEIKFNSIQNDKKRKSPIRKKVRTR